MAFVLNIDLGPEGQEKRIYKDILPAEIPDDNAYVKIFNRISPYMMIGERGADMSYELFQITRYIVRNRIPGDFVECGVWRGGSVMLTALALRHFGDAGRDLYLYDTFAGMTEPDEVDVVEDGVAAKPLWVAATSRGERLGFGGSVEEVRSNLLETGYAENRLHFVAGDVIKTIPATLPGRIALLRLDTDWYRSTLHELRHLYDLVVPNGVVIIDDYGWCRGARQAADEFFGARAFKPLMHRIDQSARVIVKPAASLKTTRKAR
jgi:O-methyltransferase